MNNLEQAAHWVDAHFPNKGKDEKELYVEIYLNGLAEGYHKGIVEIKELFLKNFKDNNTNG